MKREPGSSMGLLPMMFAIAFMGIISLMFLGWMKNMDTRDDIDIIARQYILRMESTGYLTDADRVSLIQELTDIGATNINLSGTSTSEVGYGNKITLHIQGNLKLLDYQLRASLDVLQGSQMVPFHVTKTSTAKY